MTIVNAIYKDVGSLENPNGVWLDISQVLAGLYKEVNTFFVKSAPADRVN